VAHLDQGFLDALDAGPGVAELEAADLVGRRAGVADYARAARPAAKGVDGGLVDLAAGREAAGLLERLEGLLGERAEHAVGAADDLDARLGEQLLELLDGGTPATDLEPDELERARLGRRRFVTAL